MKTLRQYLVEAEQALAPAVAPVADTDGPGYSFDSAKGFKDAITKEIGSVDPEAVGIIDKLIAAEPDGTVDVDQTLYNMVEMMDKSLLPNILEFVKTMISTFTELTRSPEWAQVSPADQASVLQSIKDMQASLPQMEKDVANAHAEFEKNKPMMQQNITDKKMNKQMKGAPVAQAPIPSPAAVQEDAELARWRKIAGLA
jgi:hypothetical protein